ncbi:MAG: valine--tRNA ligase [Candidatus Rokuibacteriota bacterium]
MTQGRDRAPYDAAEAEARWRARWDEWGIHRWDPRRPRDETFVVDSPPPTVSGALHVGHVFSYTHQDLIVRYQRMRGFNIFYPMGWDDNGLPTERRVQNYFNVRCDASLPYVPGYRPRRDRPGPPELVSRPNFIELCHEVTAQDELAFEDLFRRLGLSVDWSLEYATIDDRCRRLSQLSFLRLHEAGEVYQSTRPTMWDVDFRTAVAQAELEDREVRGALHRLRFGVDGGGPLPIATTRPELLAACVAVMVHPEDSRYRRLIGSRAITPLFGARVPILADARVDPEKGTGAVMVCTFGDATDVEWWRDYELPLRHVVDRAGRLAPVTFGSPGWESEDPDRADQAYGQLAGLDVGKARARVVELLREAGALDGEPAPLTHTVKFFEKGDRPLELIPARQWFIRLLDHRAELIEQGERIEWHPAFMRARYRNWVEGLNQDWCISRQRYFGVPFPVWYPLDGQGQPQHDRPILAPPAMLPVDPLVQAPPGYGESQRGTPGGFIGDPDVQDTWATSSLSPQIESRWELDPERHRSLFPMDVRPQSHEIIRTWAFYTIAKAWLHQRDVPWHHAVISGWVLDPDRKKMSKSKGNVVTPTHLLDAYSADGVRYWAARARPGADTAYDESVFKVGKRLVTKLSNAGRFVLGCLGEVDDRRLTPDVITTELDRAFAARLGEVVSRVTEAYEDFDWAAALEGVETFFWAELCDDYLEMVKTRAYREALDAGRLSALATLRLALSIVLRLFAPVLPTITEELWSRRFATSDGRARSVHTSPWPAEAELAAIASPQHAAAFEAARAIVGAVRQAKGSAKVSLRWPVAALRVTARSDEIAAARAALDDIRAAGVIQEIAFEPGQDGWAFDVRLADSDHG